MRRLIATAAACALSAGLVGATGQPATAARTTPAVTASAPAPSAGGVSTVRLARSSFSMSDRFAREKVVRGDQDVSPTKIDHVIELQARLRWAGVYDGNLTGYFGDQTKAAVKKFQKRRNLRQSGRATHATWYKLIKRTIRGEKQIPSVCKRGGWHACYDRSRHQVTLWRDGRIHNSWLVRGGAVQYPTRTGSFTVYLRSRHHVSSIYDTPMPYAQFFSGGQAFHASYYMTNPFSGHSHGCVNMYIKDARQLWNLTSGSRLYATVYGAWD